jgi:galactose mutarotase-like enzyme
MRFAVDDRPNGLFLIDREAGSEVRIVPARGGLVASATLGGVAVLAEDESGLADPTKNVRGGIPILFPSPGKLAGDRYRDGAPMKQHGFARDLAWRVEARSTDGAAAALLAIEPTPETRARFPFDFRLAIEHRLADRALELRVRCDNRSPDALPLHFGLHPYFAVPDVQKLHTSVETRATRAFDNAAKRELALGGPIDLTAKEIDLHLSDHGSTRSALSLPGRRIAVEASEDFTHWVVWTLAGRDFVCLEPWTAPADALHTGERLIRVAPGTAWSGWVRITREA